MDNHCRTLYTVLNALLAENKLLGWNVAPQKSGCVLLKIKVANMADDEENGLDFQMDSNMNMPSHLSYRKISNKQTRRNYLRAQRFQKNPLKRLRSDSPEFPRSEDLEISETGQGLDLSVPVDSVDTAANKSECLDLSSMNHDALDHGSTRGECMTDCVLRDAADRSVVEIEQTESPGSSKSEELFDSDSVSICSDFSDKPDIVEPCKHKGCRYGPPTESREEFHSADLFYCCECKNNPFYPDVTLCADCLIMNQRHKKHKRHARSFRDHKPPLGDWNWAKFAPV